MPAVSQVVGELSGEYSSTKFWNPLVDEPAVPMMDKEGRAPVLRFQDMGDGEVMMATGKVL